MSAYADDKKTLAYRLGESLSDMTDHYLLMTATPHKGDPENFCLFLALLDRDVYGNITKPRRCHAARRAPRSTSGAPRRRWSRFPDPETGEVKKLFTKREVKTVDLRAERGGVRLLRCPDDVTSRTSRSGLRPTTRAAGRAVGFTMAMLQRRMASSVYAVRRSLERMKERREEILDGPRSLPPQADRTPHTRRLRRAARGRAERDCSTGWRTRSSPSTPSCSARRSPG